MFAYLKKFEPPSADKRWKIVAATMRKLGNQRNALIEALHTLQEVFGYLDKPGLMFIGATLRVPLSQVYGAATFYNHFMLKPQGKHTCVVCTGTACYIKGAEDLMKSLRAGMGIGSGETTKDGELSLLTTRCFGACGLAPAAVIDGEMLGHLTPDLLVQRLPGAHQHAA